MIELSDELTELKGTIEEILFADNVNSFGIFNILPLNPKEDDTPIKLSGIISPLYKGVAFRFYGNFVQKENEKIFEFSNYEILFLPDLNTSRRSAKKMLTSEPFDFASSEANTIIRKYKENTIEYVLRNPSILKEVEGIDPNKINSVLEKLEKDHTLSQIVAFLKQFSIPSSYSLKLYTFFKDKTVEVLKTTPMLAALEGALPVAISRYLSVSQNIPVSSKDNMACFIIEALYHFEAKGNTFTPVQLVTEIIQKKLNLQTKEDFQALMDAYKYASENNFIQSRTSNETFFIARTFTAKSELAIAAGIQRISGTVKVKFNIEKEIKNVEEKIALTFSEEQRSAIRTAFRNNFSIITGPAGCGKTSVLGAITKIFQNNYPNSNILLCAPTGKAATRMTESTGMSAFTVHHALSMRPALEESEIFDSHVVLNHDLIILDEGSMLDNELSGIFFSNVKTGTKVIILGDSNQLPSVGCGDVLAQIIKSGCVPVTKLTSVYRQDSTSPIIVNANKIKDEDDNLNFSHDFAFLPAQNEDEAFNLATSEFLKIMPSVGRNNIALLSPYRYKTKIGCNYLNKTLEPIINKEERKIYRTDKAIFKKGDIIIRTQNDNHSQVCNGAIGIISDINSAGFIVDFGDRKSIFYKFPEFNNFDLAYANTVHKSQGSEYDTVILIVMPEHISMLSNSIVYTGVTRARKRVLIIGDLDTLKKAIHKKSTIIRYTLLSQLIKQEFVKNGKFPA